MLRIPVGDSDFSGIRREGYYYIDKTGLILELLKTRATKVTLITRPRRFGKTLGMSMLAEYFDICKSSKQLFEGLEVSKYQSVGEEWMNQWPAIFFSLKSVDGMNYTDAYAMLEVVISDLYQQHLYLLDSKEISQYEKDVFDRVAGKRASLAEVKNSLLKLTQMMHCHYGKPVILLIDEYDVPLAKASEKKYYAEMLNVLKGILQALKDNASLKFAVITGCLRIAKESIFTGTNNFVSDTIADTRLNEYFGFTEAEVMRILSDANLMSHVDEIKEWYDGYHFGEFDVYCPWDVMNHVNSLLLQSGAHPKGYWKNTSDNAIIRSFIEYSGSSITKKMEVLLAGGYIIQKISEDLTYDYLHSSEENLWSILYLTGYLTKLRKNELPHYEKLRTGEEALKIPNIEIREIFEETVAKWFEENVRSWNRKSLFSALWNGDAEKATEEMTRLLRRTISYHDYREDFYHAFLAGVFAGAGYAVESNREHGEGRSDIIVQDVDGNRTILFEAKYSKIPGEMENDCKDAIRQIDERLYAIDLKEEYGTVHCYGISFCKKRCLICLMQ